MTLVPPGDAMEPPPDAFEPQSGDATGESAFRRRLRIAVTLTVVAALIVLAAVEGGGYIIRRDTVESTPVPTPLGRAAARLAVIDAAGALSTIDRRGGSVVAYPTPGVALQFPARSPDGSHIAAIGQGPDGGGVYARIHRTPGG